MGSLDLDPRLETLLRSAADRAATPLSPRHRAVELASALAMAGAIAALAAWLPAGREASWTSFVLLLALLTLASRVRFTVGAFTGAPTQPFIVAAFLLLPPAAAVTIWIAADMLVRLPDYLRRRIHPDHLLLHFGDAWPALGPALVIGLLAPGEPSLSDWPVVALALLAQIAIETVAFEARAWLAHGIPPRLGLREAAISFAVDGALAPIGLVVAEDAWDRPFALLSVMPLVGLLAVLARERERRMEHVVALSDAYRGTALLMGEMLESEDPYTGGEHTWGVVTLVLRVGDQLGLGARERRHLEFTALLHDIGKLRTPPEILNKPGPLTEEEWAIVRRHPVDGQRMLERIGGMLAEVGISVRAHHERWDGGGYPDGIAGEAIPLSARIVCVCDAFSAMTTNRAYRQALPAEVALAELRACAGTQFDPEIVDAIEAIGAARSSSGEVVRGVLARLETASPA
jgi:HD-GYP domain-containing protein (c-di-GMP phosphodiesterase class II)